MGRLCLKRHDAPIYGPRLPASRGPLSGGYGPRLPAARGILRRHLPRTSGLNYYSSPMTDTTKNQLDLELVRLSKRIEELVATIDQLQEENRALRQRHESLATERASLLHKNEQVRTRVEAMIGRLKTLEHGA